jgi:hypothetical protein
MTTFRPLELDEDQVAADSTKKVSLQVADALRKTLAL